MNDKSALAAIESDLLSIDVPATGRLLGSEGTQLQIVADQQGIKVDVTLGFPAASWISALRERIQAVVDGAGAGQARIDVETRIESHSVAHGLKPLPGVKNIIAVASGKGGVGKSTIAANLAVACALEGAAVGLLDADIYGPSQPTMLGLESARPESTDGKSMEPLIAHGLQTMSIGYLVDDRQPMAWRGPMVTSALTQLLNQTNWKDLDYLFVDMPPGTGDIQLTLAQRVPVSGAIIVTTPQNVALADARKAAEMFRKVNVPLLGIVENMSTHVCSSCGHEEPVFGTAGGSALAAEYEVPLLGQLPLVLDVRAAADAGTPAVALDPAAAVAIRLREIAQRVAGELAATGRDYSHLFPKISVEDA
ncbi:MAG TPA: iron-sulfur cluster carrier protein ApbC [Gammaproteobacteria bacterium]|nr:iron-sulfur cluster carrier protein ApbC [Gammaproteobacteria bacterium]